MRCLSVCFLILCVSAGSPREGSPRKNGAVEPSDFVEDKTVSAPAVGPDEGEVVEEEEVLEGKENLTSLEPPSTAVFGKCDCRYVMSDQNQWLVFTSMAALALSPVVTLLSVIVWVNNRDKSKRESPPPPEEDFHLQRFSEMNDEFYPEKPLLEDEVNESN